MASADRTLRKMLDALEHTARTASVLIDGDEASRIVADRAAYYVANPDPTHRSLAGDYYSVDYAAFLRTKKLLVRIGCLPEFPCSTSLWMKTKYAEGHMNLTVHNGTVQRYYAFGKARIELGGEMAECVKTGRVTVAPLDHPTHTLTVLAPVFDSLGDVVGVLELSAMNPAAKELAPAWS